MQLNMLFVKKNKYALSRSQYAQTTYNLERIIGQKYIYGFLEKKIYLRLPCLDSSQLNFCLLLKFRAFIEQIIKLKLLNFSTGYLDFSTDFLTKLFHLTKLPFILFLPPNPPLYFNACVF